MWLACATQEEIAAAVGVDQKTASNQIALLGNLEDLPNLLKVTVLHQDADFAPPLYNVWTFGVPRQTIKSENSKIWKLFQILEKSRQRQGAIKSHFVGIWKRFQIPTKSPLCTRRRLACLDRQSMDFVADWRLFQFATKSRFCTRRRLGYRNRLSMDFYRKWKTFQIP
jgi:hypothetical protein